MISFLNPLLLWGASAVSVPILIHLLLRQRPRRRPWAAMAWLRAAVLVAQRRYKLTNLLLLLLRCLALLLLALALSGPSIAGLGLGGRLVIVLDTTASMGPLGEGAGALEEARRELEAHGLAGRRVHLLTWSDGLRVHHTGSSTDAEMTLEALKRIRAGDAPGGLDAIVDADADASRLLEHCNAEADVLLISDFRQDDGGEVRELLEDRVRSLAAWRVGRDGPNAFVRSLRYLDDLVPGFAGDMILELAGDCQGGSLAIDDGIPAPVSFENDPASRGRVQISLPPLDTGRHVLRLDLDDPGLRSDDRFEYPLKVRSHVQALVVGRRKGYLHVALEAASRHFDIPSRLVRPGDLATVPLPTDGLLGLRAPPPAAADVAAWVADGGVLWSPLPVLRGDEDLAPLVAGIQAKAEEPVAAGAVSSGISELDTSFDRAVIDAMIPHAVDDDAEVLLHAGDLPLVVAVPWRQGWVIAEVVDLETLDDLAKAGGFPEWVRRTARDFTHRARRPEIFTAGRPPGRELVLHRDGEEIRCAADSALLAGPGLWEEHLADGRRRDLVVLPAPAEGRLVAVADHDALASLGAALPRDRGSVWSWYLLAALLLLVLGEGALASWAGKAYGR